MWGWKWIIKGAEDEVKKKADEQARKKAAKEEAGREWTAWRCVTQEDQSAKVEANKDDHNDSWWAI